MTSTPINLRTDLPVEFVQGSGGDDSVIWAMLVSTATDLLPVTDKGTAGRINYLMKARHGSPFEHNSLTFRVEAPIFVFREFMRHRIASYNEQSGRYTEFLPDFYFYPNERPLVQAGSSAHPDLQHHEEADALSAKVFSHLLHAYQVAWDTYQALLHTEGVANEVARAVLPVSVYSRMYVTMNARALMNFLSLRTESEKAAVPSKPQWEIARVADQMEAIFAERFPLTHAAFEDNGRVAP